MSADSISATAAAAIEPPRVDPSRIDPSRLNIATSIKQAAGTIDITSKFRDTLDASFTGSDIKGSLTMNGVSYDFTAAPVSAPAGMYTAALDGVRASWSVRPDGSVTGVQFNGGITGRDFEQAELQQLNAAQFQPKVRNKRKLQQADQAVKLSNGTLTSRINGHEVTGQLVTGTTRFG